MTTRTTRADVLRKIRALMALANDESGNGHQREAARAKVIDLRLKHGVGDDEMEAIDGETVEFLGMRFMFYGQQISPLMDRIRYAVDSAVSVIGQDSADAVELLEHLRKDVRYQEEQIVKARDAALRKRYWEKRRELFAEWDDETDGAYAHNQTVSWIKGDLRKDVVERIVGLSEKAIWEKHWAWMEAQRDIEQEPEPCAPTA